MGRLIEFQPARGAALTIDVGDVLLVGAAGVVIQAGLESIEIVGPLVPGVVATNGHVLSPEGAPNTLLVFGRRAGRSVLDFKVGDPFHSVAIATLKLEVR